MPKRAEISFVRHPLDGVLSGTGNLRVLRELVSHGGALPVSRLVRASKMTPVGVRTALSGLAAAGVVETMGGLRTVLYRVPEDHPLRPGLEGLFRCEADMARRVFQTVREAVAGPEAVTDAWLFGSAARGEDRPGSDLDIAILVDRADPGSVADGVRETLYPAARALRFSPSVVAFGTEDLRRLAAERAPLWQGLVSDGKVLKGRSVEAALAKAAAPRA